MKKTIYLFASVILFLSCKKESSNPTNNTTNNPTSNPSTAIAKYGNGITDIEGNTYKSTIIGKQEWMAENLKVSKYNDGTSIPQSTDSLEWIELKTGAWCYYNNEVSNNNKFGKLYNWYALSPTTNGNKNVCPTGWHVPTYNEWDSLIKFLGGDEVAGGKMKEVGLQHWNSPNKDATNSSLFTGLPGGYRHNDGYFKFVGTNGYWWSSSQPASYAAWYHYISYENGYEDYFDEDKGIGMSVRCLKD